MGEHLIEFANKTKHLQPLTMEEIDNMLDEAEFAFDAGGFVTHEDVFHSINTGPTLI